jgi:hypothetical protein
VKKANMLAQILIASSAGIFLILGTLHLFYTFASRQFNPRDGELAAKMNLISPMISRQTTMWRAWIGFNASHSAGAMMFGLVYGYLALVHFDLLVHSSFLSILGGLYFFSLLALAKLYWFRIPFVGIFIALVLYLTGFVLAQLR